MYEECNFRSAKELLLREGVYESLSSIEKGIPSNMRSARRLNKAIEHHLQQWSKNYYLKFYLPSDQGSPREIRFQYDFVKGRIAVEAELSSINKIYHSFVRLFLAYREGKIDAGVIITTNTRMGTAAPYFDKVKDWIELADLKVPLLLIGIQ